MFEGGLHGVDHYGRQPKRLVCRRCDNAHGQLDAESKSGNQLAMPSIRALSSLVDLLGHAQQSAHTARQRPHFPVPLEARDEFALFELGLYPCSVDVLIKVS